MSKRKAQPALPEGGKAAEEVVDLEILPGAPTAAAEMSGWALSAKEGGRDPGEGSEIRLALKPGRYGLTLKVYDMTDPRHREDAVTVTFNEREVGTFRRGGGEGWFFWEVAIPPDAFVEGRQALRFVRRGEPVGVVSVRFRNGRWPSPGFMVRTGWNRAATRFMYAPTLWVTPAAGARAYVATLRAKGGKLRREVRAEAAASVDEPGAVDLASVWDVLPSAAAYTVRIEAIDADGNRLARTAEFSFFKVAAFGGPYRKARSGYVASGKRCAAYVLKTLAEWKTRKPGEGPAIDFPAVYYASYVRVLVAYAAEEGKTPVAADALATATKIGLHLLATSTPADWAYPHVPLSNRPGCSLQVGRTAMVGTAYVGLAAATGDPRFLEGAMRIAETLRATQLSEGRWYFRVSPKAGRVVEDYTSDQAEAIELLDVLVRRHGRSDLAAARDRAVAWMLANPVRTHHWQQQWDDVALLPPYTNLEFYDVVLLGQYLAGQATAGNGYLDVVRGLFRYVEDQFVLWENSYNAKYITPGVQEQYVCYDTIDAHVAHYIRFCLVLHEATGEATYLAKARAMADTLTVVQHAEGYYPTWMHMTPPARPGELGEVDYSGLWPNCMSYVAEMLMKLGRYVEKVKGAV